jgi:hypothetical protein
MSLELATYLATYASTVRKYYLILLLPIYPIHTPGGTDTGTVIMHNSPPEPTAPELAQDTARGDDKLDAPAPAL